MDKTLRNNLVLIAAGAAVLLVAFALGLQIYGHWYDVWINEPSSSYSSDCNVAVVPIIGEIASPENASAGASSTTMGDDVVAQLQNAESDDSIKAVLVRIDSTGGEPAPAEEIMNILKGLSKPTVALIREDGDSAAYLIATGANHIIASHFSSVGSIGITESYLNNAAQDAKNGVVYEALSSGPYKDMFSSDKPLTEAEKALAQRDVKTYGQWFIQLVSQNRNLPLAQVAALADGSSLPGELALKAGLIDELGDQDTAAAWLKNKIGGDVSFCQ